MGDESAVAFRHRGSRAFLTGPNDSLAGIMPEELDAGALCYVLENTTCYEWFPGDSATNNPPSVVRPTGRSGAGCWKPVVQAGLPVINRMVQDSTPIDLVVDDSFEVTLDPWDDTDTGGDMNVVVYCAARFTNGSEGAQDELGLIIRLKQGATSVAFKNVSVVNIGAGDVGVLFVTVPFVRDVLATGTPSVSFEYSDAQPEDTTVRLTQIEIDFSRWPTGTQTSFPIT